MFKSYSRSAAALLAIITIFAFMLVNACYSDATSGPIKGKTAVGEFFDDFNYSDPNDAELAKMGWTVKESTTEGPGPIGCSWSKSNVTFINDPAMAGNKLARLTSTTDGTNSGTSQAEIFQQRKFYEGTYAARVRFTDSPVTGPDGDSIVETFFAITPLEYDMDPNYCECDFEYMPNGGWGDTRCFMYETTWETYQNEPWQSVNTTEFQFESFEGWHELLFTVKNGYVKYYIDGKLVASHSGKYYPEHPMSINFNLWFVNGGLLDSSEIRKYVQDIDWVYFKEYAELSIQQVRKAVQNFRKDSVSRKDTVEPKTGSVPAPCTLICDREVNTGDYKITITIPAGNSATSLRLYENDELVMVKNFKPGSNRENNYSYVVRNKAKGDYVYRANLSNGNGTLIGEDLTVKVTDIFFDDFIYSKITDKNFSKMGWTIKESTTDGPGPIGCSWTKENVTLVNDPDMKGNKVVRLTSITDGTNAGTSQGEIYQQRKFYEGTYAARVKFNDSPDIGPDGDSIVETFFAITPLKYDMDPDYCECDFEYMPNGGWGDPNGFMYETTWETYQGDPWNAVNITEFQYRRFEGWHTLVFTVKEGVVRYYIDGDIVAEHSDKYYPEHPMSINFNLWFVNGGLIDSDEIREYTEDIDWVFYAEDVVLTCEQAEAAVRNFRASNTKRTDTVKPKDAGLIPQESAVLSVDSPQNSGDYNIQVTVPANSNARELKLYENGRLIMVKPITPGLQQVQTFNYQAQSKPVMTYKYQADLSNENGTKSSQELDVEVMIGDFPVNVAINKPATGGNGLYINPTALNDGDKTAAEGHYTGVGGEGLQWAQIDFGKSYDVNKIVVWHYYADGRIVHDLIIQLSNDPNFETGVVTVFNNDTDNSAGLGSGTDEEYAETPEGKTIVFDTVNARYVRHYQNGALKPDGEESPYNQIVELEVWTAGK